jgi:hypothetical protein
MAVAGVLLSTLVPRSWTSIVVQWMDDEKFQAECRGHVQLFCTYTAQYKSGDDSSLSTYQIVTNLIVKRKKISSSTIPSTENMRSRGPKPASPQ